MSIKAINVGKVIGNPPNRILTDISCEIKLGEFVALTGRSGSGKSTLLYILSTLDHCSEGSIEISGIEISKMKSNDLSYLRNVQIGFIFQFHYLLAELSAFENVLMPARKTKQHLLKSAYAKQLLVQFGLEKKMDRLPRQLSGGEQQRVAIARSLIMEPKFLFADEPTGSLDSKNGELVMNIIKEANKNLGTTIVMVTHDTDFASMAQRQIQLLDGKMVV